MVAREALTFDVQFAILNRMSKSSDNPFPTPAVSRRRMADLCSVFASVPRWQIIDALRASHGKNITALAKRLGLSHTAASQHVKLLRQAGVLETVLADEDDLRITHQRLNEKHLLTDADGKQWIDLGRVRVCLD